MIAVGTVLVKAEKSAVSEPLQKIIISYPSRLDSACTDPGKLYSVTPQDRIYPTGQINFCADICKEISVSRRDDNEIVIDGNYHRKSLILHSAILMQKALGATTGFNITVNADIDLRHCGLGSSASVIQGVGANEHLVVVQSVGGSGVCGHFGGGLIIMTGKAVPIVRVSLPEDLKIVFGIPNEYTHPDANSLIAKENDVSENFEKASEDYSREIAYRLLNEAIPELVDGNYKPMKEFIFDYRWDMGSIKNCAYAYPAIAELAEKMRHLRNDDDIDFIFLSTAGPGFCMITKKVNKAKEIFEKLNMKTIVANIHNDKYKIIERREK